MAFSIWRIFTYVLGLVGTAMALPLLVAYLDGDTASFLAFVIPMSCGWAAALSFCLAARGRPRVFDGFSGIRASSSAANTLRRNMV